MKRIKVCILQNGFARGGTDTFVINLCKSIDKTRFDLTVVNPGGRDMLNSREQEVMDAGVKVHHTTEMYSLKGKLKHLWQLYRFLRNEKFDTFHSNVDLFNGPQMFVAWAAGVPNRACHSHNSRQAREIAQNGSLLVKTYQKFMRYLCKKFSTRQCGCSEEAMQFLFPNIDRHDTSYPQIIYNGIDQSRFHCTYINIPDKKNEIGIRAQLNILVVGHIGLQKNPKLTVEIFKNICYKRNDIDLVWVGKGDMEHEIHELVSDYGLQNRVHFMGHRSDVNEIMKCCDLFLFPSFFEGLGIVMIEAQTSGLPCLASDQVPKSSDCGGAIYLSLSTPPEKWAEVAIDILEKKISFRIDSQLLANFTVENMTKQMQVVLTPPSK